MRKFKLWNEELTEFIDMSSDRCLAKDPDGLGIEMKLDIVESDSGYYLQNRKASNTPIAFTLIFGIKGNAYESYDIFTGFINQYPKLVLEYQTNDQTLYRDVYLQRLGKTEKTIYNTLECKVAFIPLKGWYQQIIETPTSVLAGAYFGFHGSNQYYYNSVFPVTINNPSLEPTPIKVEIESLYFSNPFMNIGDTRVHFGDPILYSGEKQIIIGDHLNGRYYYQKLVVDGINPKITLSGQFPDYVENQTFNFYGKQNMDFNSFLYAPTGENILQVRNNRPNLSTPEQATVKVTYRRYV